MPVRARSAAVLNRPVDADPVSPASAKPSRARYVDLRLLPRFSVTLGGETLELCNRAERVLVLLAINGGCTRRSNAAGVLWPESTAERALASLRTALWRLSRAPIPLVHVTPTVLSLHSDVRVDLIAATDHARALIDGQPPPRDVSATIALLRHELLIDWAEDWAIIPQEQFRQLRLHALEALAERLLADGRFGQAVVAALDAVACEPLRETAHLLLMRTYHAQGNRCEAINQYRSCARLLRDELGLAPSPPMTALLQEVLHDAAS